MCVGESVLGAGEEVGEEWVTRGLRVGEEWARSGVLSVEGSKGAVRERGDLT